MVTPEVRVWLVRPVIVEIIVGYDFGCETFEFVSCEGKRASPWDQTFVVAFDCGVFEIVWPVVAGVIFSVEVENELCSLRRI